MKKNLNKEIIIETTMNLIIEKNGSQNITIRDIAKSLNCSHPNIYNYYSDLDELRWDCLVYALKDMISTVLSALETSPDQWQRFNCFFKNLTIYSLTHTAWYKLIWFDPMSKDIPEKIKPLLLLPGQNLANMLLDIFPQLKTIENSYEISRILHRYLHGELCINISARITYETEADFSNMIETNCENIMRNFLNQLNNRHTGAKNED